MGTGSADGRKIALRDGLRVDDAETHVNPAAEVLERYVDPSFRPRLDDLALSRAHRPAGCR
jgi:hypothetical protein